MNILGIIPARGGSKGVPDKNRAPLAGKPLLWYTAHAASRSRSLSRVILSTDDRRIAALGRRLGLDVPFLRPANLARDNSPMIAVIRHAVQEVEAAGMRIDAIALLQPTSPFRTARHIDAAVALFRRSRADCVVSVQAVPHAFSLVSQMKRLPSGRLVPALPGRLILDRHQKPVFFARNGPAVVIARRSMLARASLYAGRTVGYEMSPRESIDIDTREDLALARAFLAHRAR